MLPTRYGAFIATSDANDDLFVPVVGRRDEQNDPVRTFYYPVRKLFAGPDCIKGADISLDFREYHRNEKLRKLHLGSDLEVPEGFDVNAFPFMRDSLNGGDLVRLRPCGASVMVVPQAAKTLVRTVTQVNSNSGKKEIVRFVVPRAWEKDNDGNRFSTSLQMSPKGEPRLVPEYVNIRHEVRQGGTKLRDLNKTSPSAFSKMMKDGGFEAAHFIDDSADGCVTVSVQGLARQRATMPAYSIVAAPDFFPLADQLEIANWSRRSFINFQEHFAQGAPWPLCEGRRAANIELPRPDRLAERAFERTDETVTAIVSRQPRSRQYSAQDRRKRFPSEMTDSASNEFDPGWDISMSGDDEGNYLAAYGLGSPFPEDAKLCAALNSFWPAAAPDASRTFAVQYAPTAIPLLDSELGYHRHHPLVRQRKAKPSRGWDGEQGPFFEKHGRHLYVNVADIDRSDYVSNAPNGLIDIRKTSAIQGNELIRRMDALRRCIRALPPKGDWVSHTSLWLVSADDVDDWQRDARRANAALAGPGYVFVFADFTQKKRATKDLKRLHYPVNHCFECQISDDEVAFRKDNGRWRLASLQRLDMRRHDQRTMNKIAV